MSTSPTYQPRRAHAAARLSRVTLAPYRPRRAAPAAREKLAAVATRAFGWSLLNTVLSRFGTLAIGIALARILGPESFGTFAVATVALLAVLSFNELGVSLAIVRWRDDPARIAPTVTTISVGASLVLFGVVLAAAPGFAAAMGAPQATGVVRLMAVAIVVNGAVATPAALLQREFRQGRRMAVDQVNTWLGAGVSLVLALAGMGAMSLAVGRIAGSVVSAVLFVAWSPLPYRFGFDRAVARRLVNFGLPLAGASAIVFAVGYADQLAVGSILGATALGFYVLAFNLSSWPVSIFSQPLRGVAPAAFARLQDDPDRMRSAFTDVLKLLAAVALPVCLLLAGAATPIIRFVYGSQWLPAASVLAFLGIQAAARIFFELAYDYLVVTGQSRRILFVQIAWLGLLVPAVIAGARLDGLRGVAVAQAAVAVVVVMPLYAVLLAKTGLTARRLLGNVWLAAAVAAVVGGLTLGLSRLIAVPLLACVIAGTVGLAAVGALLMRQRAVLGTLRQMRSGESAVA